jgi:2-polyprenyl-3-methyl-5-hydroxy-6-metoxy-1,4-benzoquinol methylase/Tfp pilus assembly protein PilF
MAVSHVSQWLQQASEALQQEQYEQAIALYERCIEAEPDVTLYYWQLGLAQLLNGNTLEAESTWLYVLAQGEPAQVAEWTAELLEVLRVAGDRHHQRGNLQTAEVIYRQGLQQAPSNAEMHHRLGLVLADQKQWETAFNHSYVAVRLSPEDLNYHSGFARCLSHLTFEGVDAEFLQAVERCFQLPEVDQQILGAIATHLLKLTPEMTHLLQQRHQPEVETVTGPEEPVDWLVQQPLFHQVLTRSLLIDREVERLLTNLRQRLLLERSLDLEHPTSEHLTFVAALAVQCFNNEFVFAVSPEESEAVQLLQSEIEAQLKDSVLGGEAFQQQLALVGMYRSLHEIAGSDRLLEVASKTWHPLIQLLIKRNVGDRQQEQVIQSTIHAVTPIHDAISRAVQTQYEENPYPRWISLPKIAPRPLAMLVKSLFPHTLIPAFLQQPLTVLVAGCGTGKHAIDIAQTYQNVNVLAVDLSRSSLAYAGRMTQELGINTITFQQGDILELGALSQVFPVIECVGVLHHLADPLAGWQVLVDRLEPLGLMRIALYNERARQSVKAARTFVASHGFDRTADDIRQARQAILKLDAETEVSHVTRSPDFYSLSGCRDLIFHVQEHNYTLLQIGEMLDRLGLQLIGLEPIAPDLTRLYQAQFPQDPTMTNLVLLDQFEANHPFAFSAMYRFWCQKREN